MIIRIMGEGQYQAPEALCEDLNQVDNRIIDLVKEGKAEEFRKEFANLISKIREKGEPISSEEILKSDIIVPPSDLSFKEAKDIFKGEGIFAE